MEMILIAIAGIIFAALLYAVHALNKEIEMLRAKLRSLENLWAKQSREVNVYHHAAKTKAVGRGTGALIERAGLDL